MRVKPQVIFGMESIHVRLIDTPTKIKPVKAAAGPAVIIVRSIYVLNILLRSTKFAGNEQHRHFGILITWQK